MPEALAAPVTAADRFARTRVAAIGSVATALPKASVPNAPIAERLGVTATWIADRTGIHSRHVAGEGETVVSLATDAGRAALARHGIDAEEVDLVLVATTTQEHVTPNAAPMIAHALGATRAGAIDVGAACTAFLSALALGSAQVEAGRATHVLVIGAEVLTRFLDLDDKRTAALFGDGAGAVVLSAAEGRGGFGPFVLGSDGEHWDAIHAERDPGLIRMDGHRTFLHAVNRMSEAATRAVEAAGVTFDDLDLLVFHQANARITRALGERLGIDPARVADTIADTGNTSAASLPLALAAAERDGRLREGATVLLGAFGAGFTFGAVVATWGGSR